MAISVCIVTLPGADATQSFSCQGKLLHERLPPLIAVLLFGGTSSHKHIIIENLILVNTKVLYLLLCNGDLSMSLVGRIKEVGRHKSLSLDDIGEQCGLGKKSLYKWDQNAPAVDKVKKVADFLQVSVDFLLTGENATPSALSERDQEILECVHLLDEETQRDVLGYVRLLSKAHPKNLKVSDPSSDPPESQEERMISSK